MRKQDFYLAQLYQWEDEIIKWDGETKLSDLIQVCNYFRTRLKETRQAAQTEDTPQVPTRRYYGD